jgi:hypothetical protein
MNKKLLKFTFSFFCILLLLISNVFSQTPQYYNYQGIGGSNNSFPFGQAAGKAVNWLFLAGDFNQPTPVPPGNQITKIYFYVSSAGTRTFTNLHVLMAQTTLTTLTSGSFYAGPWDTVYFNSSVSLTGSLNNWMSITLDNPYPYDPTKSLVLFVGQCGGTGTGINVRQNSLTDIKRVWSVGGCPFVPYAGGDASIVNFGIDVEPVSSGPDYLYYKFENNPNATTVQNCAIPGVGTATAPLGPGTPFASGGQFDTCISGSFLTTGGVTTGYNFSPGTSSWTISMWITIPTTNTGSACYLFGDLGNSFRCFHNGIALPNNLVLRGTGVTDVTVTGIGPSPTVVTFVYDSAAGNIKAYKNGVLAATVNQTLNITGGTGFKVGGNGTSTSFVGKMDEFRLYHKALTAAEVLDVWDDNLPGCGVIVGSNISGNSVPTIYSLAQNYPNPFNPSTKISFALPKAGNVKLVVFDLLGREIATVVNEFKTAGNHTVDFNASNLASGVYFYKMVAGDFTATKKMLLIK